MNRRSFAAPLLAVGIGMMCLYAGLASEAQDASASGLTNGVSMIDVQAIIPQPATIVPPSESGTPAVGVAAMRYALEDHVHKRITRSVQCTTSAGGTCSVTWADMGAVPLVDANPILPAAGTQPIPCLPVAGTITSTGATLKCFQTQTILGLGLLPFTTGATGVVVQVFAIPYSSTTP